jgi:hypothetical protein
MLEQNAHLYGWQKCGDASFTHIKPSHVLFDKRIKDLVARTSCLKLSERKEEEIVEAISNPIECCENSKNDAKLGHAADKLSAGYRSIAIACVLSKNETINDCKSGHGNRSDRRHGNATK